MAVQPLGSETRERVEQVLSRAAEDIQYRERLLADPEALLEETGFSEAEREVVGSLRRVALEEWGVDVRRFRAFLRDNGNKLTPS